MPTTFTAISANIGPRFNFFKEDTDLLGSFVSTVNNRDVDIVLFQELKPLAPIRRNKRLEDVVSDYGDFKPFNQDKEVVLRVWADSETFVGVCSMHADSH